MGSLFYSPPTSSAPPPIAGGARGTALGARGIPLGGISGGETPAPPQTATFVMVKVHKKIIHNLFKTPIVEKRAIKKGQALDNFPKKA